MQFVHSTRPRLLRCPKASRPRTMLQHLINPIHSLSYDLPGMSHTLLLPKKLERRHQKNLMPYLAHVIDHLSHAQYKLIFKRALPRVRQIRMLTLVRIEVVRADGVPVEELVELLVSDDRAISPRPGRHAVQIMRAVVLTSSLSIAMCELIVGVRARCHSISITSSMSHSLSSFSRNAIAKLALTSRACRLFMMLSQCHSLGKSSDAQGWE